MASLDGAHLSLAYIYIYIHTLAQKSQAFSLQRESSKFKPVNAFEIIIFKRLQSGEDLFKI